MKVLTVTDLHLRTVLYEGLRAAVAQHQPAVVAVVGDFLDAEGLPPSSERLTPAAAALALAALPSEVVLARGNHEDWEVWPAFEQAWQSTGRELHALHGTVAQFGELAIVGFPCWLGDDEAYSEGRPLSQYHPEHWLPNLLKHTGPAGRALWLMHEPPSSEIADMGAYEPEWGPAIELYQPCVTVSGHDHTTTLKTGRWQTRIGDTICVNAGQRLFPKVGPLVYCTMEFEFPNGSPQLVGPIQRHGA